MFARRRCFISWASCSVVHLNDGSTKFPEVNALQERETGQRDDRVIFPSFGFDLETQSGI